MGPVRAGLRRIRWGQVGRRGGRAVEGGGWGVALQRSERVVGRMSNWESQGGCVARRRRGGEGTSIRGEGQQGWGGVVSGERVMVEEETREGGECG